MSLTLKGSKEFMAAMDELVTHATQKNVIKRSLVKALQPVGDLAEGLAPARARGGKVIRFDGGRRVRKEGTAKALVQVGTKLTRRQAGENRKLGKSEVEAYVGTRDRVSRLVEFGTANAAPEPFLRPAWSVLGGQRALDRLSDEMTINVEKAVARARRRALKA